MKSGIKSTNQTARFLEKNLATLPYFVLIITTPPLSLAAGIAMLNAVMRANDMKRAMATNDIVFMFIKTMIEIFFV